MGPRHPHELNERTARRGVLRSAARVVLPLVVLVASCAAPPQAPPLTGAELQRLDRASTAEGAYRIEPGDQLALRWMYHPELDQQEIVRSDGKIRAARVGEVAVAGLRTSDVEAELARGAEGLRDPVVSVTIVAFTPRFVYVAGEVGRPGPVPFRRGITALQALVEAGGLLDTARSESVVLVRAEGPQGVPTSRVVDFEKAFAGEAPVVPRLTPRDVLFVPRTGIAEANVWVDQHVTKLFPFFRGAGGNIRLDD